MFFQRKPGKHLPRVCVYYFKDNRQVAIPRSKTKHLDGKPDHEIEDWMRFYAAINRIPTKNALADLGELEGLVGQFLTHLKHRGLNPGTIRIYQTCLRMGLLHFLKDPDPNNWYLLTGGFSEYLRKLGISAEQHNRTNQSFGVFYRWLQLQGKIAHRHGLLLDNRPSERSKTPLERVLAPDEVLAWATAQTASELRFMALAGYFLSLRTGELFGCRKSDFRAGSTARGFEAAKVLTKAGMPCNLVYNVRSCRRANGSNYTPTELKRGGIVGCFDQRAAREIVKLANVAAGDLVLPGKPEPLMKRWGKSGIVGISLKDLRRASLYWLGHYTEITLVGLQNHARHTDPKTTALYYRRPEEEFDNTEGMLLDLDA